ncbi:MAG TPA: EAL domain-containing protein, partial [Pseudoduganella sp.]
IGLNIDEFGAGASNLACLGGMPVRRLKMHGGHNGALTRIMLDIGHNLKVNVVATCVETESQRAYLAANGCSSMQGYYVSQPMARPELENWLAAR